MAARGDQTGEAEAAEAPRPRRPPPRFLAAAALRLRWMLRTAADLVVPAPVALFEQVCGYMYTHLLRTAARLRLAELLAAGPATAEEIAARAGLEAESLRRVLRGLVTLGVFALQRDGRFRNNRMSKALLPGADVSLHGSALYFGSPSQLRAWDEIEGALTGGGTGSTDGTEGSGGKGADGATDPGGDGGADGNGRASAFERVHGMSTWEWFERHPEEREAFADTMVAMTRLYAPGVATAYPFAEVRRLCDVGGGHGDLLAEVLLRHPHLTAVLHDAGSVLVLARTYLAGLGLLDRVELAAGSFFDSVPGGCDAYLLKNVLHDWDDARAARILDNCRRVMRPGDRLLVVEAVVETDSTHGIGPLSDLQMMVVCSGGRERGRAEYTRLLDRSSLRLRRIVATPGPMSVVEAVAV